mmetsp:Transcript_430/g.1099  ORF Transcript_430/g.1099 Transcript_430/m.1099 type:complete len:231 (-) Transcript_430:23-715(-)
MPQRRPLGPAHALRAAARRGCVGAGGRREASRSVASPRLAPPQPETPDRGSRSVGSGRRRPSARKESVGTPRRRTPRALRRGRRRRHRPRPRRGRDALEAIRLARAGTARRGPAATYGPRTLLRDGAPEQTRRLRRRRHAIRGPRQRDHVPAPRRRGPARRFGPTRRRARRGRAGRTGALLRRGLLHHVRRVHPRGARRARRAGRRRVARVVFAVRGHWISCSFLSRVGR